MNEEHECLLGLIMGTDDNTDDKSITYCSPYMVDKFCNTSIDTLVNSLFTEDLVACIACIDPDAAVLEPEVTQPTDVEDEEDGGEAVESAEVVAAEAADPEPATQEVAAEAVEPAAPTAVHVLVAADVDVAVAVAITDAADADFLLDDCFDDFTSMNEDDLIREMMQDESVGFGCLFEHDHDGEIPSNS